MRLSGIPGPQSKSFPGRAVSLRNLLAYQCHQFLFFVEWFGAGEGFRKDSRGCWTFTEKVGRSFSFPSIARAGKGHRGPAGVAGIPPGRCKCCRREGSLRCLFCGTWRAGKSQRRFWFEGLLYFLLSLQNKGAFNDTLGFSAKVRMQTIYIYIYLYVGTDTRRSPLLGASQNREPRFEWCSKFKETQPFQQTGQFNTCGMKGQGTIPRYPKHKCAKVRDQVPFLRHEFWFDPLTRSASRILPHWSRHIEALRPVRRQPGVLSWQIWTCAPKLWSVVVAEWL